MSHDAGHGEDARVDRGLRLTRRVSRVLRSTPFDPSTAEGRSSERYRRAALSVAVASVAKGIAVITAATSVPLTLSYLGSERFGMWMTLSAIIVILNFTDLGIGNSLLNAVATGAGRDDRGLIRTYVSNGLVMLGAVALVLGAGFAVAYPHVPWHLLFNVASTVARDEAGPATAVFFACFLVGMPAGALHHVRAGLQQGYINSAFVAIGNLCGLALLLVVLHMQLGLPWLVLAMAGGPVLAVIANGVILVARSPWLRPVRSDIQPGVIRSLLRVGLLFLVLQLAVGIAFTSDSLVAAHVIGPSAVAEYAVVAKLFSVPMLLVGIVLGPLWPAYREALSRGDRAWLRVTFARSIRLALVVAVPTSLALVLVGVPLIGFWVGTSEVRPSLGLVLAFGIWTMLSAVGTAIAMVLNGVQVIKFQVVVALVMALANILLSIALASRIGVAGVVWGSVVAYSACTLIPALIYLPRLFARLEAAAPGEARTIVPRGAD